MDLPDPVKIEDVTSLVEWVEEAHREKVITLWFRGHQEVCSDIRPAFLRSDVEEVLTGNTSWAEAEKEWGGVVGPREREFNNEFFRRAASMLLSPSDLVETYFLAQHHGLPTRLLDWTTNPLVALFFVVSGNRGKDGEVVVAVPRYRDVADPSREKAFMFSKRSGVVEKAVASFFGEAELPSDAPQIIFIEPDLTSPRFASQGARFSLHISNTQPTPSDLVVRLPVPAPHKPVLQETLRMMGVSWAALFPDLDHLCREMQAGWGFDL